MEDQILNAIKTELERITRPQLVVACHAAAQSTLLKRYLIEVLAERHNLSKEEMTTKMDGEIDELGQMILNEVVGMMNPNPAAQ